MESVHGNGKGPCLSKIKTGHIGGAARRELGGKESAPPVRRHARTAHPSPRIDACGRHCNISCTTQQVTEVALAEHNNVVEAIPSARTDPPYGIAGLPWGTRGRRPMAM